MAQRTTIHAPGQTHSGDLHVDYTPEHNGIFAARSAARCSRSAISHCIGISEQEAIKMSQALMKYAFAIEAATPKEVEA